MFPRCGVPDAYDGSAASVEQLKQNIARAGIVGSLVATDFKSTMIFVPRRSASSVEMVTVDPLDVQAAQD